jgi:enoyl-[acyl-carrier protein] reductase II
VSKLNPLCKELGIPFPILQGGMGNISSAVLAAAVSNAGGLGTIGVGTLMLEEIEQQLNAIRSGTSQPFCVNLPVSVHPDIEKVIERIIDRKVPVVSLSAGNPSPFIPRFKEKGIKVICVTATVKQAQKAEQAGADIIVCEGYEAAGINALNESTTLTLVPQIVRAVNVPVVAAGGIGNGKGLAAALALGAAGVQMGTRLIATLEAPYHEKYKQALLNATDEATVIVGRPFKKIRRLLKTEGASELLKLEKDAEASAALFLQRTDERYHVLGAIDGNLKQGFVNAGQIAGLIEEIPPVKTLFETMMAEAKHAIELASRLI